MTTCEPENWTLREVFNALGLRLGMRSFLLEGHWPMHSIEVVNAENGNSVVLYSLDMHRECLQFNSSSRSTAEDNILGYLKSGAMYYDSARGTRVTVPPFGTIDEFKLKTEVANGRM